MKTRRIDDAPPTTGPQQAALAATRAVGDRAILLLNEAHKLLLNARIVAAPPPSDRWFELMKELANAPLGGEATNLGPSATADRLSESLLNTAAMFLALEASDVEDQACLLSPDNPNVERLEEIATEVGEMADVLLARVEDAAWRNAEVLADGAGPSQASQLDDDVVIRPSVGAAGPPGAALSDLSQQMSDQKIALASARMHRVTAALVQAQSANEELRHARTMQTLDVRTRAAGLRSRLETLESQIAKDEHAGSLRHRRTSRTTWLATVALLTIVDFPVMLWVSSSIFNVDWSTSYWLSLPLEIGFATLVTGSVVGVLLAIGRDQRRNKDAQGNWELSRVSAGTWLVLGSAVAVVVLIGFVASGAAWSVLALEGTTRLAASALAGVLSIA